VQLEDLGLIGNGQIAALIDRRGGVAWCCLPRFDSEPMFATLLDEREGGTFLVGAADGRAGSQRYLPNTNVLETTFEAQGGAFRVLDLAPRFHLYERTFRPTQILRILEPLRGTPRVRIVCEPRLGWSRAKPQAHLGSHHVEFEGFASRLRLTTDLPLSYLGQGSFALTARQHLVLAWGAPVEEPLAPLCERFLAQTVRYWQRWVKHCNIPVSHQPAVIRSALALKLHCFEDTGAIVAAMTTSIPEFRGSGRTWDYRYCWLRDAYYALNAFRLLGHYEEREAFIHFLLNVASNTPDLRLSPLYRVDGSSELEERLLPDWPGFEGDGPVRVGNAAALQSQHDIFGEMVLALAPIYLDDRFEAERSPAVLELLERLARRAIELAGTPDAGIWEHRSPARPRTFSNLMCWAAADRMALVAARHAPAHEQDFRRAADRIRGELVERAWCEDLGTFTGTYGGRDLDAALLQIPILRLLPPRHPRLLATIDALQRGLSREGWLMRYRDDDGLGLPDVPFVLCTFWLVEALAIVGRAEEATALMERALGALSPLGLLSEDYDAGERRLWGNFPQAYSHVGLIHAAFYASPRWSDVL
jgi:GH15 family glucan-1,4-alpha-glucosidase